MTVKRKYRGTTAEMLISLSSLTEAAISHKATLIAKRSTWADPFFGDHNTRIEAAINTYLGVDSAKTLRNQTSTLKTLVGPAYTNLGDVKVQLEQDFKDNPDRLNELKTTLGYNAHWSTQTRTDQEILIQLLYQFKQNLTPAIRTELEAKGISGPSLTAITDAASDLMAANITQESLKQARKELTEAAVIALNKLYDDTIAIATISHRFFQSSVIKDQFSYSKILKNLQGGSLSTLFEGDVIVSPDQPFILDTPRITAKTVITAYTTSNLVYACRNETGCVSSGIDSYHITPEVPNTITKIDLVGDGSKLVLTNLTPGFATVSLKIQG